MSSTCRMGRKKSVWHGVNKIVKNLWMMWKTQKQDSDACTVPAHGPDLE